MRLVKLGLAVLVVLGAAALPVRGSVIGFGTDGLVTEYSAAPGQELEVKVYLYETFAPATEAAVLDAEEGLFSAGLAITRTSAGPTAPAGIATLADIVPNAAFNDAFLLDRSIQPGVGGFGHVTMKEARDILESQGVAPEAPSASVRRLLLGTFTFTAGSVALEATTFSIHDNAASPQDDTVTWALPGLALDNSIQPFEFTITTTPEPASMTLLAISACLVAGRRRRRRSRVCSAE